MLGRPIMMIISTTQHGSRTVRRRIIWQILLPQHLPSSYVMSSIQIYTQISAASTVFRCKTCLFCTFQMRTLRAISVALEIHARAHSRVCWSPVCASVLRRWGGSKSGWWSNVARTRRARWIGVNSSRALCVRARAHHSQLKAAAPDSGLFGCCSANPPTTTLTHRPNINTHARSEYVFSAFAFEPVPVAQNNKRLNVFVWRLTCRRWPAS